MAKFGPEIHTRDYNFDQPEKVDQGSLEDQTSDLGIENDPTSAGVVPRISTGDVKAARLKRQEAAIAEYRNNPPHSNVNEKSTRPLSWEPNSPELSAAMERVKELQANFDTAKDRLASADVLRQKENEVDREIHKIGMAELAKTQSESIKNNQVLYETTKGAIDPLRPDSWREKQKTKFAQIVYALHKQGLEYKLSPDMPPDQQVIYKAIIAAVKEGRYNPDANSLIDKARNATVFLAASIAAQKFRASRRFRKRN